MKRISFWMCFVFMAIILTSCSKEEKNYDESEFATLSFGAVLNDLANGRAAIKEHLSDIPGCSDASPAFVEVVLSGPTNVGTIEEPLVVQVNSIPGSDGNYFTKESSDLELQPGIYTLQYFTVFDGNPVNANSNMIWIAPMAGGSLANFVNSPLPMEIDLRAGVKKYVDVEVLCFDDRVVNEYGYAFFELDETRGIEFCIFGNYCDETGRHFPAKFSVDAWRYSGDSVEPKGKLIAEDLTNITGTNSAGDAFAEPLCLVLPDGDGADEYYIEITLMDSDVYNTEERIIRKGVITDEEVRSLFRGDSNNEYFHFRAGCDQQDNPDLFGDDTQTANFTVTIENLVQPKPIFRSGVFNTPVGASAPAPLLPGDSYEFEINAGPVVLPNDGGTRLSFVAMFVQSNDLFFAPSEEGIHLYDDNGNPVGENGPEDVTDQVLLWDAGTEVNEATGGPNQKPQQAPKAEDEGADENGVVTEITGNTDSFGNVIPDVNEVIMVTIENTGDAKFLVRIENVSTSTAIPTPALGEGTTAAVPISPGVYTVHTLPAPFFMRGEPAEGSGLVASEEGVENIAEDGFPQALASDTKDATGLIVPLSPGVWAVQEEGTMPIYELGVPDFGEGLEGIAEDGTPMELVNSLTAKSFVDVAGAFNTPVGASSAGPIGPGQSYQFSFTASEDQNLSLATMFIQSNDWFYAFDSTGIVLFVNGMPISGNVTSEIFLYDSGTEINEYPGAGLFQVIRQPALNTGPADPNNVVRLITTDVFNNIPPVSSVIKVTIQSN